MWCDYIDENVAQTIVESLEMLTGNKVIKSLLKATSTEPGPYGLLILQETKHND